MPEGDTILSAARRVGAVLVGREIVEIETPHPRHAMDRWPERLSGRAVRSVDARGKHLFIRFEGDLTLHSHLRMTGRWGVYRRGERWRRSPRRAWLVIRTADHEVVEFDGPVLELMTDSRTRFDRRLAALGTDLLADDFDEARFSPGFARTTRAAGSATPCSTSATSPASATCGSPRAASGGARSLAAHWRGLRRRGARRGARPAPADEESVERGGRGPRRRWVFERAGLPCRRCNTLIRARGQGDDNRTTYWCPACQP